jgi:phosphoglycerate dehydrogenase-like enzyme
MKILFAAHEQAWGGFLGSIKAELPEHDWQVSGRFGFDSLEGIEILIPTMSSVGREHLGKADRLRLIQQCGAGLESVDLQAASELNIPVANVPTGISGNADSVSELGIYMMIGLSRNLKKMAVSLNAGTMGTPSGLALSGKTAGIIGLGGIGRALARRLKAFDMRVIGVKKTEQDRAALELGLDWVGTIEDIDKLLSQADFVILCLPMNQENHKIIGRGRFSAMKPDAFLINLSRGGLVDRDALEEALASNAIAGAGLDVFWEEPPDPADPIFSYNVMATPHIAGSTDVSVRGIVKSVAENIRRIGRGEPPLYVRNLPAAPPCFSPRRFRA